MTPVQEARRPARAQRGDDTLDALEHALTRVARAMLRKGVPPALLAEGGQVDRAGYWAMVRIGEVGCPVRLSDLATSMELDLSTVSRQVGHLVDAGLVTRAPDPGDGRARRVALTERGAAVLEAVRAARREELRRTLAGWDAAERGALAEVLTRLADDMHGGDMHGGDMHGGDTVVGDEAKAEAR